MEKYRFNKEKHLHELLVDGKYQALTGCTTVLDVLAKPALIQWSANMAVTYIGDAMALIAETYHGLDMIDAITKQWPTILQEAKSAHRKRKEKSGEFGTKTHEAIEQLINNAIEKTKGYIKRHKVNEKKAIQNFIDWALNNNVKFLASEKHIYSEKLWLGGIVDFICEIDGKVWIGDIKTSKSGIYPENFWQCAGYDIMLKEMGVPCTENVKGYLIVNLKETGEILEKRSISNEENIRGFLACLDIYRIQEKIKNQITS